MGFGVGVALLVDATLIRMVVPAAMAPVGRWNWYLPSWLSWLPELHVEADPEAETPQPTSPCPFQCRSRPTDGSARTRRRHPVPAPAPRQPRCSDGSLVSDTARDGSTHTAAPATVSPQR